MLEENEMKVLRKINGKTKIAKQKQIAKEKNRVRKQQIRETCGVQPTTEWMERRRRERGEHVTNMDTERLVKISRKNIPRKTSRTS